MKAAPFPRTHLFNGPTAELMFQLRALDPDSIDRGFRPELAFHPKRKWRFDLAWPDHKVAVEIDGGSWVGGRHTSGSGFEADCEKLSEAAALGWRVLRVTPKMVKDGRAVDVILRALAYDG